MANVLDLRRRIRSVKSTRQITKAMKMIAAAKLRRAQERAMSGRPYANMLASVIGSLMRHIDLYDPSTGDVRHPLLLAQAVSVVPFDLTMEPTERTLLISGPNTGGKSVLLKSVALCSVLIQCGVPSPVGPGSSRGAAKSARARSAYQRQ